MSNVAARRSRSTSTARPANRCRRGSRPRPPAPTPRGSPRHEDHRRPRHPGPGRAARRPARLPAALVTGRTHRCARDRHGRRLRPRPGDGAGARRVGHRLRPRRSAGGCARGDGGRRRVRGRRADGCRRRRRGGRPRCASSRETLEHFGRIDILVNNAGVSGRAPLLDPRRGVWRRVMATNVEAMFFLSQAVLPTMREQRYGRIVNIGSVYGSLGPEQRALPGHVRPGRRRGPVAPARLPHLEGRSAQPHP